MSSIIAGRLEDLPSSIRHRLGTFRHQVFVQRLHWEIPGVPHDALSEWDAFDGSATVHLVALSLDGEVCGCARLMPTTGPYLLRDVFPELAGPDFPPSSPSVWEMSRFAGSGLPDHRTGSTSGMSLFPYAMALAISFGATRVIGVVSRSVARLYRRFGLDLHDIGAGTSPDHTDIVACAIDIDATTFQKIQCDPDALLNSISFFGHPCLPEHGTPVRPHVPRPSSAESGNIAPFTADGKRTIPARPAI
ncbi:acyl-homoserine-lactone synthase [Paraburkholderia sp. DHOC27]|uniref:acyl-homoserine-lactone synthase n=1 Tax=Paraburkholderia sp. DHOC27 TaxID=2303330 RepID=UPI000E3C9C3E|nr:acyl-homoserine-lactone synthase [Paraburkholderia sp. DHOC27]RFU44189.1 GNAT family N-acetyltransferase [Paraburkholderia sp. DHOC27]